MGGFKQKSLNFEFQNSFFSWILMKLEESCILMRKRCISSGHMIKNHEEKIRNYLHHYYLDQIFSMEELDFEFPVRFSIEEPVTYDEDTDTYIGRCDIKVESSNFLTNKNKMYYYIIECKRIDGSPHLNKQFLDEGVSRFIEDPPKYPSPFGKNIMFGFVVKKIDISANSLKLSTMNMKTFSSRSLNPFKQTKSDLDEGLYEYTSDYEFSNKVLQLVHLFFDFSQVIDVS